MSLYITIQISAPSTEYSIELLAIGSIILLVIVVVFFLSSLIARYLQDRYEQRLAQAKDRLYPHIMEFLEDETKRDYFENYFSGKGVEFTAFKEIIFELLTHIEGEDAEKLQRLLQIDKVYNYHKKMLDSWFVYNRFLVYNYINYIRLEDQEVTEKIMRDIQNKDQLIAFSAATALMASTNVSVRAEALDATLQREHISRMAILEMLYKFHNESADEFDEEADHLKRLIHKTHYPPKNIRILIQGISEIGYHQLPPLLHEKLKKSGSFWTDPHILSALIESMGNYYHLEASSEIRANIYHESDRVRLACVHALGNLPFDENLRALYNMLFDPLLEIRYEAVQSLVEAGEEGEQWLRKAVNVEKSSPSLTLQIEPIIQRIQPDYGVLAG